MNIYLTVDPAKPPPTDYIGVLLQPNPDGDTVVPSGFQSVCEADALTGVCMAGEAWDVLVPDAVEFLPTDIVDKAIAHWCDLVGVGGTITLGCIELSELAYMLDIGRMTTKEANEYLHAGRHANYGLRPLAEALEGRGLKVTGMGLENLRATITAKRN